MAILVTGNSRQAMVSSVEASLKRLKTDRIDLYWVHVSDGVTPLEEIVRGFDDLTRAGKILYAGLSNFPAWRIARAATNAELRGAVPIAGIQVAATSSLVRALSRYNTGDQYDAFDVIEAVTHVHEVESRHHFPTRSSAKTAHILVAGWGFRSQILWDGTRQIGDLLAPGDFCHTSSRERESWFSIEACGPARIAVLDLDLLPERARAAVELGQQIQQDDVIRRLRARLVSLGRRDARGRLAYLIAEIHARLAGLGLTKDSAFDWPFTQEHLADILGLTPVHTNRVLGRLRGEGLLAVRNREVTILDLVGLRHVGAFDGG